MAQLFRPGREKRQLRRLQLAGTLGLAVLGMGEVLAGGWEGTSTAKGMYDTGWEKSWVVGVYGLGYIEALEFGFVSSS